MVLVVGLLLDMDMMWDMEVMRYGVGVGCRVVGDDIRLMVGMELW